MPVTFTGGVNYENMSENRKGYNNFRLNNGTPEFGHKGDLRRDERNLMWNVDPYLQTQWQLTQKLSLDAGVRYSSVWFDSNDHYIAPGNGDDSGDASYHHWLPAGSLKYALTDAGISILLPVADLKLPLSMSFLIALTAKAGSTLTSNRRPMIRWKSAVKRGLATAC